MATSQSPTQQTIALLPLASSAGYHHGRPENRANYHIWKDTVLWIRSPSALNLKWDQSRISLESFPYASTLKEERGAVCKVYSEGLMVSLPWLPSGPGSTTTFIQNSHSHPVQGLRTAWGRACHLKAAAPIHAWVCKVGTAFSQLCLQQEWRVCSGARCFSSRLGGISFKTKPFPLYPPFRFDWHPWGDSYKVSVSLKFPTMLISHTVIWLLSTHYNDLRSTGKQMTVTHR